MPGAQQQQMMARPGVCVTGEARAFVYPGVRANLALLLRSIRVAALYITIARTNSCDGQVLRNNASLCANTRQTVLELDAAGLRAEFPQTPSMINVLNVSSCSTERNAHEACCLLNARRRRHYPTPAFLQYLEVRRCADWMLALPAEVGLTHIIRTRPDLVYLHPHRLDVGRYTQPTFLRKAAAFSYMAHHRTNELFAPGDWFIVVPIAYARRLFTNFYNQIDGHCRKGALGLAAAVAPEASLLADLDAVLGERGHDCGKVDEGHWPTHEVIEALGVTSDRPARNGGTQHQDKDGGVGGLGAVEFARFYVDKLARLHPEQVGFKELIWGAPWARCLESFALGIVMARADGTVDCSRASNATECNVAARRIVSGQLLAAHQP